LLFLFALLPIGEPNTKINFVAKSTSVSPLPLPNTHISLASLTTVPSSSPLGSDSVHIQQSPSSTPAISPSPSPSSSSLIYTSPCSLHSKGTIIFNTELIDSIINKLFSNSQTSSSFPSGKSSSSYDLEIKQSKELQQSSDCKNLPSFENKNQKQKDVVQSPAKKNSVVHQLLSYISYLSKIPYENLVIGHYSNVDRKVLFYFY
jgi:hypothetical protein